MAIINRLPGVDGESGQGSFLSYSRGAQAPSAQKHFAETGTGTKIIQGLANVLPSVAKVTDIAFENSINNFARDQVDAVNDEIIGRFTGVNPNSGELQPVPKEISDAEAQGQRMTAAYNAGRIKDSYYWARMDAISRTLKTRYPGHRDVIDSKLSSLTGSVPANALQRALRSEASKELSDLTTAGTDTQKRFDMLADAMAKDGSLLRAAPDFQLRAQQGNPYSYEELRLSAAKYNGLKADLDRDNAIIDNSRNNRTLNRDNVELNAQKAFNVSFYTQMKALTSPLGKTYDDIQRKVQAYQANGGTMPQADWEQLQVLRGRAEQLARNMVTNILDNPEGYSEDGITTRRMDLGPEKAKALEAQLMSQAMGPISLLQEGRTNPSVFGEFKLRQEQAELSSDERLRMGPAGALTSQSGALRRQLGETGFQFWLTTLPAEEQASYSRSLALSLMDATLSGRDNSSLTEKIQYQRRVNGDNPGITKTIIDTTHAALANWDKTDTVEFDNAFTSTYTLRNNGLINQIEEQRPGQRVRTLLKFMDPQIIQKIKDDPIKVRQMTEWGITNARSALTNQIGNLNDFRVNSPIMDWTWDEKTGKVRAVRISNQAVEELGPVGGNIATGVEVAANRTPGALRQAAEDVNMILDRFNPLLDLMNESDKPAIRREILRRMGVNFEAVKEGNIAQRGVRALSENAAAAAQTEVVPDTLPFVTNSTERSVPPGMMRLGGPVTEIRAFQQAMNERGIQIQAIQNEMAKLRERVTQGDQDSPELMQSIDMIDELSNMLIELGIEPKALESFGGSSPEENIFGVRRDIPGEGQ